MNLSVRFLMGILIFLMSIPAIARDLDRCSMMIQNGVRDRLSEVYNEEFLHDFHSALCSENVDRIKSAKEMGIKLGYGKLVGDFAGSIKKIASYQESMCSAKDRIQKGSTFYQLVRNHVSFDLVSAFNECVKITEGGMEFDVSEGEDGDSITIDVGYSRYYAPRAKLEVTDLIISPKELEDKVDCKGPLAKVRDGKTVEITQPIGVKGVTCRPDKNFPKSGDNDFSVILHTSVGHIAGYIKPFHRGKSNRLEILEAKYDSAANEISEMRPEVSLMLKSLSKMSTSVQTDYKVENKKKDPDADERDTAKKMTRTNNSVCFLAAVKLLEIDAPNEYGACRVVKEGDYWVLHARRGDAEGTTDSKVYCTARCIEW